MAKYRSIRVSYLEARSQCYQKVELGFETTIDLEEGDDPGKQFRKTLKAIKRTVAEESEVALQEVIERKDLADQAYYDAVQQKQASRRR